MVTIHDVNGVRFVEENEKEKTPQDVRNLEEFEKNNFLKSKKIEIVTEGPITTVTFDGQEITNVTGIRYEHTTDGLPQLTISVIATDVMIKQPVTKIIIDELETDDLI